MAVCTQSYFFALLLTFQQNSADLRGSSNGSRHFSKAMGHDYNLPFGPWGMEVEASSSLGAKNCLPLTIARCFTFAQETTDGYIVCCVAPCSFELLGHCHRQGCQCIAHCSKTRPSPCSAHHNISVNLCSALQRATRSNRNRPDV